jgi:hypothetical protein
MKTRFHCGDKVRCIETCSVTVTVKLQKIITDQVQMQNIIG